MDSHLQHDEIFSFFLKGKMPHLISKFTPEEDEKLKLLIKQYGENDWNTISSKMEKRNPRQCKDRWVNYLSPNLNFSPWTEEDDKKLIELHNQYGSKWTKLASFFQSRTSINIKNRWLVLHRHQKKEIKKGLKKYDNSNNLVSIPEKIVKNETKVSFSGNEYNIFEYDDNVDDSIFSEEQNQLFDEDLFGFY